MAPLPASDFHPGSKDPCKASLPSYVSLAMKEGDFRRKASAIGPTATDVMVDGPRRFLAFAFL